MQRIFSSRQQTAVGVLIASAVLAVALFAPFRDRGAHPALAAPNAQFVSNDSFNNAAPLWFGASPPGGTQSWETATSTAGATLEAGETAPCGPIGASVWYNFQPQTNGNFEISTAGSNFDTIVAVYTFGGGFLPSPPGANLNNIACNDDSGGATSLISMPISRYTQYFIQVGGKNGATGNLVLRGACNPACPPGNDDSGAPTYISVNGYSPVIGLYADTRAATNEPGEPHPCGNIGKTVWYQLYADQNATIVADTTGSNFDTVLAVYEYGANFPTSPPGGFTTIVCNDNAIGAQSKVTFETKAGQSYWIQLGGANGANGDATLNVACSPVCPPYNDSFMSGGGLQPPSSGQQVTTGATVQQGEPLPCGGIGKTVWYSVYVPGATNVVVDTGGSDFDTVVAAYELPYGQFDIAQLRNLGCNDNAGASPQGRLSFHATNDRQFFVQIGGHAGASGNLRFNLDCDPTPCPPFNDSAAAAQFLPVPDAFPFTASEDVRGATIDTGEATDCGAMSRTVWFAVSATSTSTVSFDTAGSDFDTAIATYLSSGEFFSPPGGNLERTQCGLSAGGQRARVQFTVPANATVFVQVGAAGGGAGGNLVVNANCVPACPPRNDNSANAYYLYPSDFDNVVDTTAATLEPDEQRPCGDIGATAWYHVYGLTNVDVRLSAEGTAFPAVLAVYQGAYLSPPGGVTLLGCSAPAEGPAAIEFSVAAGQDYWVQAGGAGGAAGLLNFHMKCLSTECPVGGGPGVVVGPDTGGPVRAGVISLPNTGSGGYLPGARDAEN